MNAPAFDPIRALTVAEATVECLRQDFGGRVLAPARRPDRDRLTDYVLSAIDAYVESGYGEADSTALRPEFTARLLRALEVSDQKYLCKSSNILHPQGV